MDTADTANTVNGVLPQDTATIVTKITTSMINEIITSGHNGHR